jgi:hypothetical protein
VLAQRGHDHLARQVEVAPVEAARERRGPLGHEVHDLDQLGVLGGPPAGRARGGFDLLAQSHHSSA